MSEVQAISLLDLIAVATGNARSGKAPFHTVSVIEARDYVTIKDGKRTAAEDGSQDLTLTIGKHTLPLDCIKMGTSRLSVSADQVEPFTAALAAMLANGEFDESIAKAQALSAEQAAKPRAPRVAKEGVAAEDTAGLDLDALGTVSESVEGEVIDTGLELV